MSVPLATGVPSDRILFPSVAPTPSSAVFWKQIPEACLCLSYLYSESPEDKDALNNALIAASGCGTLARRHGALRGHFSLSPRLLAVWRHFSLSPRLPGCVARILCKTVPALAFSAVFVRRSPFR